MQKNDNFTVMCFEFAQVEKKNIHRWKGQSAVEFALAMPIFLLMAVAIFEFGRLLWTYSAVNSASREAVRYAVGTGDQELDSPNYIDCPGIIDIAIEIGAAGGVTEDGVVISYDNGPGTTEVSGCPGSYEDIDLGDRIVVVVVGHFNPIPFLPVGLPEIEIVSESRRTVIKEVEIDE